MDRQQIPGADTGHAEAEVIGAALGLALEWL